MYALARMLTVTRLENRLKRPSMRIATWNVNSVKARLPTVIDVLKDIEAEIICLQELKCETDAFPYLEIEELGYNCAVHGQKTYNGVAILSKFPLEDIETGLPGDDSDDHARFIEATVLCDRPVRVGALYLPNGNPAPGPKYDYKLGWMQRLEDHARERLKLEEPYILAGDYNVIPRDEDCWDICVWRDDALALPQSRDAFRRLQWLGIMAATNDRTEYLDEAQDIRISVLTPFASDQYIRARNFVTLELGTDDKLWINWESEVKDTPVYPIE